MQKFGFREGRETINLKSIFSISQMMEFIMRSTAMKVFFAGVLIFILVLQGGANLSTLPILKDFANAGTLIIIGWALVFFYQNYIIAIIAGIRNYMFWKVLLMVAVYNILLYVLPLNLSNPILDFIIRAILFSVSIAVFFPTDATLRDSMFGYIVIRVMTILIDYLFVVLAVGSLITSATSQLLI